jgi:hypothetical protein
MLKESFVTIHNAIHNKNQMGVSIDGVTYPIEVFKQNGCRYVDFWDNGKKYRFIEQNPRKMSPFAQRAKNGEKITWGVPAVGRWIEVSDTTLAEFSKRPQEKKVA